jgi:hypothetical protein
VAPKVTTGNVHDTRTVKKLTQVLTDKLYGDKGYLSKALAANFFEKGVTPVTTVRKNMSYIEHSRHRSMNGFMWNLLAGLLDCWIVA